MSDPQHKTMADSMATANRYQDYQWGLVAPHLGSRVLEVGVGYGGYTRRMLESGREVLGADIDDDHLDELRRSTQSVRLHCVKLDLNAPAEAVQSCREFGPDCIVCMNVLEHLRDDQGVLEFFRSVALPGATLILLVPALGWLFNALDADAGHLRRYGMGAVRGLLERSGWEPRRLRYINLPGIAGWIVAGLAARRQRGSETSAINAPITNQLVQLYDRLGVGVSRLLDPVCGRFAGLSLLAVARKP